MNIKNPRNAALAMAWVSGLGSILIDTMLTHLGFEIVSLGELVIVLAVALCGGALGLLSVLGFALSFAFALPRK